MKNGEISTRDFQLIGFHKLTGAWGSGANEKALEYFISCMLFSDGWL
jgi:hypothetical protein